MSPFFVRQMSGKEARRGEGFVEYQEVEQVHPFVHRLTESRRTHVEECAMSWLTNLIKLANEGLESSRLSKSELRDQIFNLSQMAHEVLSGEEEAPQLAAGAMKLLELHLQKAAITPDRFTEISDKEYVANTMRLIHDNAARLTRKQPASGQTEIQQMASSVVHLPDYTYFVEHYDQVHEYRRLLPQRQKVEAAGQAQTASVVVGGVAVGGAVLLFGPFLCFGLLGVLYGMAEGYSMAWLLGGGMLLIPVVWGFALRRQRAQAAELAGRIHAIESSVNLERFGRIERELGGNYPQVVGLQKQTRAEMERFFGVP